MLFKDTGVVVVQPYEDSSRFKLSPNLLKQAFSLITG